MVMIDVGVQPILDKDVQIGIAVDLVALVEDDIDQDAALLRFDQAKSERIGRERIRLHKDFPPGLLQLADNGVLAAALRGKESPNLQDVAQLAQQSAKQEN